MARIQLTVPPEQAQSITRAIFDIVREHGPLTISDVWPVWDHVKVHEHNHLVPHATCSTECLSGDLAGRTVSSLFLQWVKASLWITCHL